MAYLILSRIAAAASNPLPPFKFLAFLFDVIFFSYDMCFSDTKILRFGVKFCCSKRRKKRDPNQQISDLPTVTKIKFFVCFSYPSCPPRVQVDRFHVRQTYAPSSLAFKRVTHRSAIKTHFLSPMLPQVLVGAAGHLEHTNKWYPHYCTLYSPTFNSDITYFYV